MKTTRWITVAALLSCAGIRLQAQNYDAWLNMGGRHLSGPSRQLLLVHGIFSSSATWDALTLLMYETGDTTWHVFRPNLYTSQPFVVNRDSLARYMVNKNLASDVAVVGHSMGGIIARLASRLHPTQGILTIGTPHYGAPLARQIVASWDSPMVWYTWFANLIGTLALVGFPVDNQEWVGPNLSWYDIQRARYDTWHTVDDFFALSTLDLSQILASTPAMADLAPGSPAMIELNSEAGVSLEQTPKRGSMAPSLDWADYPSGPFILLGSRGVAHQMGDYLQMHGWATFNDGLIFWSGADWNSETYWDVVRTGTALMTLGYMEACYWAFWNEVVVGGMPNDGIVPGWSMVMPRTTEAFYPFQHALHTEETSRLAPQVLERINAFFSH